MNDLASFYAESAESVDSAIARLIDDAGVESERLKQAMVWSLFGGGKRFRPALIFAVGETLDVPQAKLMRAAAAIEMIHTYSLIHDDLPAMDDDDLRRGRKTCHKKFDEATAILAGDALQVLAFGAIAGDETIETEKKLVLVAGLAAAAVKMVAGQQMDLASEGEDVSGEQVEAIHRNKTGALIEYCAAAAAAVSEADAASIQAIKDFAVNLGLLFQITDDLLDVSQTSELLGKTAGKDLTSGKATYPAVFGFEGAVQLANDTHSRSISAIDAFGSKAARLRAIAYSILDRRS